jgi:predicted CoA-binding protein
MSCEFPTINEPDEKLKDIFENTKSIAIIGLSPKEEKDSNKVAKYLQSQGYKIIPVYPKEDTILGEKVYRSLSEITESIDMVNIFRKPEVVATVVDEVLKRDDVKTVWAQKGIVNNEAMQKAKDAGLNAVQNRCTMVEDKAIKGL